VEAERVERRLPQGQGPEDLLEGRRLRLRARCAPLPGLPPRLCSPRLRRRGCAGIAQPRILPCGFDGATLDGYECFRVYLQLDSSIADTVYASARPPTPVPLALPRRVSHPRAAAVFGSTYSDFKLFTEDDSNFFQAPPGLDVDVGGVNPALYQFVQSARFDSWFTVGADDGESQNALS